MTLLLFIIVCSIVHGAAYVFHLGGMFNPFNEDGSVNISKTAGLVGFNMAVAEINADPSYTFNFKTSVQTNIFSTLTAIEGSMFLGSQAFNNGTGFIISDLSNAQTISSNHVLNSMGITSLSINANQAELGRGVDFPYKLRMCPSHTFHGMVYQSFFWEMIQCHRLTTFSTPDYLNVRMRADLDDQTWGIFDFLFPGGTQTGGTSADFVLDPLALDYHDIIDQALALGGKCFVAFLDIATYGKLLEQAYNKGLFHQDTILAVSDRAVVEGNLWEYMTATASYGDILKGAFMLRWEPTWMVQNSDKGLAFLDKFINQPALDCNSVDSEGHHLYSQHQDGSGHCVSAPGPNQFQFSSFQPKQVPFEAAFTYDAVYVVAQMVQTYLNQGMDPLSSLATIPTTMNGNDYDPENDFKMIGVTGDVSWTNGVMVYQVGVVQFNDFFARGDHELSHIYRVYNFQTTAWNKPNPSNDPMHGWVPVGRWSRNDCSHTINGQCVYDGGQQLCDGNFKTVNQWVEPCINNVIYRSADGSVPKERFPNIYVELSASQISILQFLSGFIIINALIIGGLFSYFSNHPIMKATQVYMMWLILGGVCLGAIRTLFGTLPLNSTFCNVEVFSGHLAFGCIFGTLALKNWRLNKVMNVKSLKRVKISNLQIFLYAASSLIVLALFVSIFVGIGLVQISIFETDIANQLRDYPYCTFKNEGLEYFLYACYVGLICYNFFLIFSTWELPNGLNDTVQQVVILSSLFTCCGISINNVFLEAYPVILPNDQRFSISVVFGIVSLVTLYSMYVPKLYYVLRGSTISKTFNITAPNSKKSKRNSIDNHGDETDDKFNDESSHTLQRNIINSKDDEERYGILRRVNLLLKILAIKVNDGSMGKMGSKSTNSNQNNTTTNQNAVVVTTKVAVAATNSNDNVELGNKNRSVSNPGSVRNRKKSAAEE